MTDQEATALRALRLLDLTDLSDNPTSEAIDDLCARAQSSFGPVAAVCIWPQFVTQAKARLAGSEVRVATVANFPGGDQDPADVFATVETALEDGADEVDLVMPWRPFLEGDTGRAGQLISDCRSRIPVGRLLKVIHETGELSTQDTIEAAALLALDAGADFIKT